MHMKNSALDVITIGTAARDALAKSESFRSTDDSHGSGRLECVPLGAKIEIENLAFSSGGGAVNAAVTFARQGFKTGIVARVGDDASGDDVRRDLAHEHIDISRLIVDRKAPTAFSIVLSSSSGERSVMTHHGAATRWSPDDFHRKPLDARWLYVSSLGGDFEALREIFSIARRHRMKIAMNPGMAEARLPHKLVPFLQNIDVLIMNREEGAKLTGVSGNDMKEIFRRIDELQPGIFVLTDGRNGATISDGRRIYETGIFREKRLVDKTGTGDAFASGFVAGIIRRFEDRPTAPMKDVRAEDIAYASRLGMANAAAKVEGMGSQYGLLRKEEFERDLRWRSLPFRARDAV